MQAPGSTDLDPAICRFTWIFKREFASKSTAAKPESFMGAYSIWYKDSRTSRARVRTLSQIDGDFWMMKQLQSELERGDTVEWGLLPKDMLEDLNSDWWLMGVQLPDINAVCDEATGNSRGCPL